MRSACRCGWCGSQRGRTNYVSEVSESAGLLSANYGQETLPSIGKGRRGGALGALQLVAAWSKGQ